MQKNLSSDSDSISWWFVELLNLEQGNPSVSLVSKSVKWDD